MTPEIKQRIEQIKNGIIPKGYKKTFDGFFPNDWETVRLGDIFKERVEKGREDLPLLSITGNEGVIPRSQISRKDSSSKDKSKYLRICKGDIGYNTMRMWQGVSALSNYEGIVSPAYTVLKPTDGVCTKYFAYLFKTEKNIFKFYRYSQGLVDDTRNLKYNSFKIIQVTIPPVKEQQKIVAILSAQDKVIECYEKKIEQLKRMKKYYLQNMFPKRGETVPKIRLKGFTDSWEQRKFSDGVSEVGDGLHGTPTYSNDGKVYFVNGNNLVDGKIVINSETKTVDESHQSTADKSLDDNTILMSINGTIGNLAYYSGEKLMLGKSAAYIKISEFDKKFIYAYLQAPTIQAYFMNSLTGTTIKNLGLKAIREMRIIIPQDVEEQVIIGKYFSILENLITLHQHKLEEEKKKKKAMQQLLLTGIVRTN